LQELLDNSATNPNLRRFERAAQAISRADALIIGTGAGMGVDSGLPDFRGTQGFWKAYPPFRGKTYAEICSPQLMRDDPEQAWGFYGHCLSLYRSTLPHAGFQIIKQWSEQIVGEHFVFTTNIDGHFEREGFDRKRILEIHGTIHYLQCSRGLACGPDIWSADGISVNVDETSFRAVGKMPTCDKCGAVARPNVLMFGDDAWVPMRTVEQEKQYEHWLKSNSFKNIVAIEFGAGTTVPTVRIECQKRGKTLIRVNPRDYLGPIDAISIPLNALEAIDGIDGFIKRRY
jgi:NAD-dependent SIR2 family protein deacetylase